MWSIRLSPTKLATGSVSSTLSRVAAVEVEIPLVIPPLNLLLLSVAPLVAIPALAVALIPSVRSLVIRVIMT